MKKGLFILSLISTLLCAEEGDFNKISPVPTESVDDMKPYNRRFIPYVKLGPQLSPLDTKAKMMPSIGFGFRSESVEHGVDLSFDFCQWRKKNSNGTKESAFKIIHPRLLYINYLAPGKPTTPYYGFGGSWGTISNGDNKFSGIIGNFDFGYEFLRDTNIRQMVDLNLSQPLLPFYQKGSSFNPSAEFTYSLGF